MHPGALAVPARLKVMAGTMRRTRRSVSQSRRKHPEHPPALPVLSSRQAQATIDKTMGKTAAYQKQEKQKKQTAGVFMEEEKKEKNGAEFFILVYGVTSVLLLFFGFISSIGDVTRLSSVARNARQEFLYKRNL